MASRSIGGVVDVLRQQFDRGIGRLGIPGDLLTGPDQDGFVELIQLAVIALDLSGEFRIGISHTARRDFEKRPRTEWHISASGSGSRAAGIERTRMICDDP
jgi:hypothetical protein